MFQLPAKPSRLALTLGLGAVLLAGAARADERPVRGAVDEAASVHAIAIAARLCSLISESDLAQATSRMDRVHAGQLAPTDQETYLILRTSDSFRNLVFASALRRAQGGCGGELHASWRDVEATLVAADPAASTANMGGAPASSVR